MELRTLLYEKHGPICTITMSRPEVLNAYNLQMVDELRQVGGTSETTIVCVWLS